MTIHTKKDGHHEQNLCKYCLQVGHLESMCINKFLGKPKSQKVAVTEVEENLEKEDLPEGSSIEDEEVLP